MRQKLASLGLSMALVAAATAAAAPEPAAQANLEAVQRDRAAFKSALRASAEPRDWALAAQWLPVAPTSNDGLESDDALLLSTAAAAAPDDILVQWWAATVDVSHAGTCGTAAPPAEAFARLLAQEPDNGAVWLSPLALAAAAHDEDGVDRALTEMAAAPRFDLHTADAVQAWTAAFERHPLAELEPSPTNLDPDDLPAPSPAAARFALAMAMATMAMPNFSALTHACRIDTEAAETAWQRAALCEAVARRMDADEHSLLVPALGLSILHSVGREGPSDLARRRELDWLQGALQTVDDERWGGWPAYLEDFARTGSEIAAMRRALQRAGLPLTPPLGWLTPGERRTQAAEREVPPQ